MNKTIVASLSLVIVLGLFPVAFAKGPVKAPMCAPAVSKVTTPEDRTAISQARYFDGSYNLNLLKKRLKLSEEQKSQMRLLFTGFEDRTRDARSNMMSIVKEKKDMLRSGDIDQKKLAEMDDNIVKLRSELFGERLKLVRDRLALLTPGQTQKLAHMRELPVCRVGVSKIQHRILKG
jgi:hypothetical protein